MVGIGARLGCHLWLAGLNRVKTTPTNNSSLSLSLSQSQVSNATELGGYSGGACNDDDFVGIDQGSLDGVHGGDDRFCGTRLLDTNSIISKSKPFQLKVRSNSDQQQNALNSQVGFALRYVQLPCVI